MVDLEWGGLDNTKYKTLGNERETKDRLVSCAPRQINHPIQTMIIQEVAATIYVSIYREGMYRQ